MRTNDFVKLIAAESGQTIVQTEKFYDAMMTLIEERILAGEDVPFRNLFTIKVKDTPARTVKCGFDGKEHVVPERKAVSYKTSAVLKRKLAGKE